MFKKRHHNNNEKTSLSIFRRRKQRENIVSFATREGELRRSLHHGRSLRWEGCEMSSGSSSLTSTLLEPCI